MTHEIVPHENNRAREVADFLNSDERFADPTQRRDYLEHLDENDFLDLVQQTAGLVRTGTLNYQHFDGSEAGLMGHEVSDHREKEQLLRDTWTVAKEFLGNTNLPDEDALDYAALTTAGGLLYTHPFADGNGRTGRMLSYLIARGSGTTQEIHDILAEFNGGGNWNVMPLKTPEPSTPFWGNQPLKIEWTPEDPGAFRSDPKPDALGGGISRSRYNEFTLRKFIEKHGNLIERQITESLQQEKDDTFTLNGTELIMRLVDDPENGIANANELLEINREFRASSVHHFLHSMKSKQLQKPISIIDVGDEKMPDHIADDEFSIGIWSTASAELGKRAIKGRITNSDQQLIYHRAFSTIRHKLRTKQDDTPR